MVARMEDKRPHRPAIIFSGDAKAIYYSPHFEVLFMILFLSN